MKDFLKFISHEYDSSKSFELDGFEFVKLKDSPLNQIPTINQTEINGLCIYPEKSACILISWLHSNDDDIEFTRSSTYKASILFSSPLLFKIHRKK